MTPNDTDQNSNKTRLPDEVRSELFGDKVFDVYREIAKKHGAESVGVGKIAGLVLQMLKRGHSLAEFPKKLSALVKIDEAVSTAIAIDVFNEVLIKYKKLSWIDFKTVVASWGGEIEEQAEPVESFVKSYVLNLHGIDDAHSEQRLESIFRSLLNGRTTAEAAIERMQRPLKLNGLELDEASARGIIEKFDEVAKEKGYKKAKKTASPPKKKQPPKPAKPKIEAFTDEDAKEIEKHKQEKKHVLDLPVVRSVEDVVKQVCEHKSFAFENPVLTDRCAKIVESRVREVRDASDTRRKLEASVDHGGLGIKGRQLSEMTKHIENTVRAYQKHVAGKIENDKAETKQAQKTVAKDKDARAQKEEQIMNKRYASMTGRAPSESVAPVGPKYSRTSAAIAAHIETQQREGKIDVEKVRAAINGSKETRKPVPKRRPPVQPKMADVVSSKRLAGPTEELSRLSLIDYRRMSKDPVQATTKIKDKIDLLENRGYEMKVAGIKAWRESPLNRMYMKLAETAVLSGIPLQEALEQAQSAGGETLTDDELKAIMNLNAVLRF